MTGVATPLWSGRSRTLVAGLSGTGLALMAVGWLRVSGGSSVDTQIAWLDVGVAGLLLSGLANALWLLRGRRSVVRLRVALLPADFGVAPFDGAVEAVPFERRELVAAASMTRYHRPDCLLVVGKPAAAADRRTHETESRRPCPTCRP